MSIADFRDAYAAAIRRAHPDAQVKAVADDELEVTLAGGNGEHDVFVDNAYNFYRADPTQLDAILARYVAAAEEAQRPETDDPSQLVVLVRPRSYLERVTRLQQGSRHRGVTAPLTRPIAGDLLAFVAIDHPNTYDFPPADRLRAELKMDDDAIWTRALANTAKHLPGLPRPSRTKAIATLMSGDGLGSSLLAEPDIWDAPTQQKGGAPVVAPVAKDMVLLVHADDAEGVAVLRQLAAKDAGDPDGLTQQLFVRRNGAWEVLPP